MLELPEIEPGDYEETLEALLRRIPTLTDEWTNLTESGVGVTLLELLTYISLRQRENMNKISGEALCNLARLFGCEPKRTVPPRGIARLIGGKPLRRLTKLYSDEVVFETLGDFEPSAAEAVLFGHSAENRIEPYVISRRDMSVKLFCGCDDFVAGFSAPFESGREYSVFFRFDEAGRSFPDDMEGFVRGFEVLWQYYGDENGAGWHDLDVVRDETYSCFKSGFLTFTIRGSHGCSGNVYPLRALPVKRGYDVPPVLTGVFAQVCEIAAQDTKCACVGFGMDEFAKNAMRFSCALAESGEARLFINTKKGYAPSERLGVDFETDRRDGGCRLVTSSRKELFGLFGELTEEERGRVMLLVLYEKPYVAEFCSCRADGSANQRIGLSFRGIIPEKTEILVSETVDGEEYYRPWKYTDKLTRCGPFDRVFSCGGSYIDFGDNIHGAVPCERSARVIVTSLCLTDGANRPAGALTDESGAPAGERIIPLTGGSMPESPDRFFERAISERKPKTLVSEKDCEERAADTKGLFIKRAEAFATPDGAGTKPNSVTVAVEPNAENARERHSELWWYLDNVYNNLRDCCPITTELKVVFPEYVPLDVTVGVAGGEMFADTEGRIRAAVDEALSQCGVGTFGVLRADYGEMFRRLSEAAGKGRVTSLSLYCEGAEVLGDKSVIFPAHSRPYLRRLTVNRGI